MFGLAIAAQIAFAAQVSTAPAPADGGRTIVRLVGPQHNISIVSTPHGVRYSAIDRAGKQLVATATLDDLKANHPALHRQVDNAIAASATIADVGE